MHGFGARNVMHKPHRVLARRGRLAHGRDRACLQKASRAWAAPLLVRALHALGQAVPAELAAARPKELLSWAVSHWDVGRIPRSRTLAEAQLR